MEPRNPPEHSHLAGDASPNSAITQPLSTVREQCAACGAPMASDQRYCVECGQRRGSAQMPFAAQPARLVPEQRRSALQRLSPNTTLLAGVATLIVAMGVGVLIGHSANGGSSKTGGYQILTVPGTVGTGTVTTNGATEAPEEGGSGAAGEGSKAAKSSSKSAKSKPAGSGSSESSTPSGGEGVAKPEKPVVTVGSKGKGRGYQKGKFTGHFFGGEGEGE